MPKNTARDRQSRAGRRYAKIPEAADYLKVNPMTIRVMLADGRLTPYRLGPRILRVDLNEVDAAMEHGAELA
jgi:excisionase family DNA binding protein